MSVVRQPDFRHLLAMTDERGTFEHAELTRPRREHGYCTDDMARVLVVASREPNPPPEVRNLGALALRFLTDAQDMDGFYQNRKTDRGRWRGRASVHDCWGRSVWGLGTAAARSDDDFVRQWATTQFERAARRRSPWVRSMAFASLGAAELLAAKHDHREARELIEAVADTMARVGQDAESGVEADPSWPWPEPRLSYANAVIPDAMMATGVALDEPALVERGLSLLAWLLAHETIDGHLSVAPVGGDAAGGRRPAFDQQPIEVATLADACARAAIIDGHPRWAAGVAAAMAWFEGENDGHHVMFDLETGGSFDGLQAAGANRNQGTESTLAFLSTCQHSRCLAAARR